jgi:transposase
MCEILVGLGDVNVLSVDAEDADVTVTVETRVTVAGCPSCGSVATSKGRRAVSLFDCCHGLRQFVVVWLKRRWRCPAPECATGSWTEEDRSIAAPRLALTDRAGRWVTEQVGRFGRSVNEVATALGCDWHTVNDAVVAYGTALVDDPDRFGEVHALGLDEVLFARLGTYRTPNFSTQLVDVERGQLLDVVEGKKAEGPRTWLENRGEAWLANVTFATLDLSATYKAVFDATVPHATQVADPFHVVKHATFQLDECRRRVQQELLGHRGRKDDPLFRARRLLAKANERLDDRGREKLTGLLEAGDPNGQVRMAWLAKEAVRELYAHSDADMALTFVDELVRDMTDKDMPHEVRSLGRTLKRWRLQIAAWHAAHVSNGPTEAVNNLIKRVKRGAFGFTSFRNYRIRSLLYAGKPNWSLLGVVSPP